VPHDRIDQDGHHEAEQDERVVLDAFGNGARDDGRRGRREHELEEELRPQRHAAPRDRVIGAPVEAGGSVFFLEGSLVGHVQLHGEGDVGFLFFAFGVLDGLLGGGHGGPGLVTDLADGLVELLVLRFHVVVSEVDAVGVFDVGLDKAGEG
jgi:hypothetical protein